MNRSKAESEAEPTNISEDGQIWPPRPDVTPPNEAQPIDNRTLPLNSGKIALTLSCSGAICLAVLATGRINQMVMGLVWFTLYYGVIFSPILGLILGILSRRTRPGLLAIGLSVLTYFVIIFTLVTDPPYNH